MKRLRVVYLRKAQQDLLEACGYIETDSPAEAAGWLNRVDRSLGRLSRFPQSGTMPKDGRLAAMGYRMVVIGEYLAFYLIRRNRVQIRRVLHGRRRYGFLL